MPQLRRRATAAAASIGRQAEAAPVIVGAHPQSFGLRTRRIVMKATASELLRRLPGKTSEQWPTGERFVLALAHGSMSVELYAPVGVDPQSPHDQDELYFINAGHGVLAIGGVNQAFASGDCLFVAAGVEHRFVEFSPGFSAWAVFWGPTGGEGGG
ncbi:MAG TPA: cupin domain-containing protein [Steroidobacteraceae bacterium]|jgi:mannose-6-phosphate isomerase-like protein (cupin superfamily)